MPRSPFRVDDLDDDDRICEDCGHHLDDCRCEDDAEADDDFDDPDPDADLQGLRDA